MNLTRLVRLQSEYPTMSSMRRQRSFLIFCVLLVPSCARRATLPMGLSWDERSGTFRWPQGEVRLPAGFRYQPDNGGDTFEGHFTSADGKVVVRYDIGWYAGVWAKPEGSLFFEEKVVEGARVWTAKRGRPGSTGGNTNVVAVTFPDCGCANFFVKSSQGEDAEPIAFIARSFRPRAFTRSARPCE